MLPFMMTNFGKDGTFPAYSCFSTMDSFRFEKIVSGNCAFQENRSFKCLVRANCVSPFIIIILIRSKN